MLLTVIFPYPFFFVIQFLIHIAKLHGSKYPVCRRFTDIYTQILDFSLLTAFQYTGRPLQSVGKQCSGAGDIQADESLSARAVHRTGVDHQLLSLLQAQGRGIRTDTERPAVYPDQVSPFERQHGILRQSFLEKAAEIFVISPQVFPQGIEPLSTLVVSRCRSDHAERIDVAHFVDIDGTVDAAAYLLIGRDDIGDLQPAMLNALLGETQVTDFCWKRSDREAKGV